MLLFGFKNYSDLDYQENLLRKTIESKILIKLKNNSKIEYCLIGQLMDYYLIYFVLYLSNLILDKIIDSESCSYNIRNVFKSDQLDQKDQKLQNRIIFKICIFVEK